MVDREGGRITYSWRQVRGFVISLAAIFVTMTAAVAVTQGVHRATTLVSQSIPW